VVDAYGLNDQTAAQTHIQATSGYWNKTIYDPYVNMLRTTTEMMSAILGGADTVSPLPFDSVFTAPDDFSERIARNLPLILQEESYFNKVVDPAAGSYYIENITRKLIDKAWQLFLETEENGGYYASFKKGVVRQKIVSEARIKDHEIATRKRSIIGVTQYPNVNEHLEKLNDEAILFPKKHVNEKQETEPLTLYRAAMPFEQLRYKTDRYSETNPRPKVWMFTFGNLALRRARSQFAGNFFGVAGFEVIDNPGFDNLHEGVKAAQKDHPDIVVLCAADEDYETMAIKAFEELKKDFTVVLAGYPKNLMESLKKAGLTHFIHVKSNLLEELKKYQKLLGIE
jgi:methylmalonyl-CoA mutase